MAEIDPQEFGELKATVSAILKTEAERGEDLKDIKAQLASINSTLSEAKGGWKLMMAVGGAAAAVGGFVAWIIEHVTVR